MSELKITQEKVLKVEVYITLTLMDAQWVIFQFLDATQFLHIYSINLFLVEIDA